MLPLKIALLFLLSGFGGVNSLWTVSKVAVQKGGSITIPCHYSRMFRTNAKYWCKGLSWAFCKEIVRTTTKPRADGVFITDYPSEQVFTITMTDLQVKDTNRYWCVVRRSGFSKSTIRTSLQLEVIEGLPDLSVTEDRVSVEEGDNVTIPCLYRDALKSAEKKWCESGNLHSCRTALSSAPPDEPSVTIADDHNGTYSVTVMKLERKDTGWYWCSAGDLQVPVHINVTQRLDHNRTATTPGGASVSSWAPGERTTIVPTSVMSHTVSSALPSLPTKTSQGITTAPRTTSPSLLTHTPHVKTLPTAVVTVTTSEQSTNKDMTSSSAVLSSHASATSASVQSSTTTPGTFSTHSVPQTTCGSNSTCFSPQHRHMIWQAVVIALGIVMALVIIVGSSVKCWHHRKHDHIRIALDDMTQELHERMEEDLEEDIRTDWPQSCLLYHSEDPDSEGAQ